MPLYVYGCVRCQARKEVYHRMVQAPVIRCRRRHLMRRELTDFSTPKDKRYEFVTTHFLPGTRVTSRAQWNRLLKQHRMTDDISPKEQLSRLQSNLHSRKLEEHRKAFGQTVRTVLRREFRQTPVNRHSQQWSTIHHAITQGRG